MFTTPRPRPLQKIVILNPKGGSGKTTLATNLAAAFANAGEAPTLIDCDSQGYCLRWLEKRPAARPRIHGVAAHDRIDEISTSARSLGWPESRHLIVDLPGALGPERLFDLTYDADSILIPIMPSGIDAYAASRFIAELLLNAQIDRRDRQLAVVANRVRKQTLSYRRLLKFLTSLRIPLIGELRDSQNFVSAAANGLGVCELPPYRARPDIHAIDTILNWLDRSPSICLDGLAGNPAHDAPGVSTAGPLSRPTEH